MAAIRWLSLNLSEGETPERIVVARVTGDYFKVLGVNPLLGRAITPEDDEPGREDVVVDEPPPVDARLRAATPTSSAARFA